MLNLTRWMTRHRWLVVCSWIVIAVGVLVASQAVGRRDANNFSLPNRSSSVCGPARSISHRSARG